MKRTISCLLILIITALLLTACPGPKPTPAVTTVPRTPTATVPVKPSVLPPTPTPDGWAQRETALLTLSLPKTWEVLEVGQGDLKALFADFQKRKPDLAKAIGSADALQGVALWAFNRPPGASAAFVDNLNIRRVPLEGQQPAGVQAVVDQVVAQYRQLNFTIGATKADLKIGGQNAASIAYSFPLAGADGKQLTVEGRQYLVLTATDLWVLSYTLGPGQAPALAAVVEQSAQSFRVK